MLTNDNCDGFSVAHKVNLLAPVVSSVYDLRGGHVIVDGVSAYEQLTVRRPIESQHVGCTATLLKWLFNCLLQAPVACSPHFQCLIIGLETEGARAFFLV
jgi:hypothetical protein